MFGRKHKIVSDINTLIGEGTVITGDIHFSGGLRVDGRICGSIVSANGKQHSLLVLSEQGMVEGKIKSAVYRHQWHSERADSLR